MAAINFPDAPSHGDSYTNAGKTWVYDSSIPAWEALPIQAHASQHATGGVDAVSPASIGAQPADANIVSVATPADLQRSLAIMSLNSQAATAINALLDAIADNRYQVRAPMAMPTGWTVTEAGFVYVTPPEPEPVIE